MAGCLWAGLLLLTISSTADSRDSSRIPLDRLLFVAFALLAFAAWTGGLLTVQTGLYFEGHTKSRVIFLLNSLFDAGSLTYLCLWWISTSVPASLTAVASGYLIGSVTVVGAGLFFWKVAVPESHDDFSVDEKVSEVGIERASVGEEETGCEVPGEIESQETLGPDHDNGGDSPCPEVSGSDRRLVSSQIACSKGRDNIEQRETRFSIDGAVQSTTEFPDEKHERDGEPEQETQGPTDSPVEEYIVVAERTPQQQLLSRPYLLLCVFFGISCCSNQWTLTTARDFLAYLGDNQLGNRYLTIFTLLMPASVVGVPFVDAVILRFGFAGGFQGINALALGYNLVKVCGGDLNVQIVGFILFSFFRSFLFGVTFSFLPSLLSQNVVGKATGIMYALAGVATIINIPLANLAVQQLGGNFFVPNLVFTILIIPCVIAAWALGRDIEREKQAKDEIETSNRLRQSYGGVLVDVIERNVTGAVPL